MKKLLLTLLSVSAIAGADVYTWCGDAGDNMWGNSNNWTNKNGYYPQSDSDTAVINPGNAVIIWSNDQSYCGATKSITLGAGNTIRVEMGSGSNNLNFSTLTLGNGAIFELHGTNAIGYGRNFTIDYGTFTADSHGFFNANMESGTLWTNGKTITLTGIFDTTDLTGSGSITLYDASQIGHGGGAASFNVSGITLNTSDTVSAEIVTSNNKVVINYVAAPEPTTATLSLLALAGLAARRRRASR